MPQKKPQQGPAKGKASVRVSSWTNLEEQFVFYASYHHNPVNVFIHLLCIWNIAWTLFYLLQFTPSFMDTPDMIKELLSPHLKINLSLALALIYVFTYPIMEPIIGTLGSSLVAFIYVQTSLLAFAHPGLELFGYPFFNVALGIHLGAWILQFIGHGVFEGRAPALLDSLDQALITAPLFVLLEVAFFFGYRKDFYERCMVKVRRNVKEFQEAKKKNL